MNSHKTYGPRAYTEADAKDFKGRDKAISDVMNLMQIAEMTTIYAMSGDGKSSLIRAGLYPRMRANEWFPIEIRFGEEEYSQPNFFLFDKDKGCTPFEEWIIRKISVEAQCQKLKTFINDIYIPETDGDVEDLINKSLWLTLRTMEFSREGEDCLPRQFIPVLVFDQFEEVINYPDNRAWTDAFFQFLQDVSKDMPPQTLINELEEHYGEDARRLIPSMLQATRQLRFKMLLALRKEYIGALDYWTQQEYYIPALSRNRYCLLPLKPDDARVVANYRIDAFEQVVEEYRISQLIESAKEIEGENKGLVSPMILSVLLDELDRLNQKEVEGMKPDIILRNFYERQLKQSGLKKRMIRILENALVDNSGRRRPYLSVDDERLAGLDFANTQKATLDKLDKEFHLVRCTNIHGKKHVELMHDRLADVVIVRRNETKKKRREALGMLFCILLFFLISFMSINNALHRTVINEWADPYAYMATIEHRGIWTTEDIHKTKGAGRIDEILWDKGDTININNMGYLSKLIVDVEHPLFTGLYDCPRLRDIKFTNKVKSVDEQGIIEGLGENLIVSIGDSLQDLELGFTRFFPNSTRFELSSGNPYLKLGSAYNSKGSFEEDVLKRMLWEKESQKILFLEGFQGDRAKSDAIIFPEEFNGDTVTVGFPPDTFPNKERKSMEDQLTYAGRDYESFTINPSDTLIGMYAFMGCKQLGNVTLNNISTISPEAFGECSSLESIDLRKVKCVSSLAFYKCFSLSRILFPDSISIGAEAFEGCRSLKEIRLPKKMAVDSRATFRRCVNLTTVYLPDTIIDESNHLPTMFSYCPKINCFVFSPKSLFNWREDSVLYYADKPAFLNMCTNPNWCAKDSSYYFKEGLLYMKDGVLIDACAGSGKREGCHPQTELLHHIGAARYPYPLCPADNDTSIVIPQKVSGAFIIVNPLANIKEIYLPYAEPKNVDIDLSETFLESSNITLIVPWHRRDAYENDSRFQQYYQIIEESFWATSWQVIKDDITFLFSVKSGKSFDILTNPLFIWLYCPMFAFIMVILLRRYLAPQSNDLLSGDKPLRFVAFFFFMGLPTTLFLFHFFALYLRCESFEECMRNTFLAIIVITLCIVLIYLQFVESGVLSAVIKDMKKKFISSYRRIF